MLKQCNVHQRQSTRLTPRVCLSPRDITSFHHTLFQIINSSPHVSGYFVLIYSYLTINSTIIEKNYIKVTAFSVMGHPVQGHILLPDSVSLVLNH